MLVIRVLVGAWLGVVAVFLGSMAFAWSKDAWQLGGTALVVLTIIAAALGGALGALSERP